MIYDDVTRYEKPADVLVQELEGEAVLLNLANELYYGLDEVGFRMFKLIVASDSLKRAYEILLSEFDVEPEQLSIDFATLVKELAASGLIAKVNA